MSRNLVDISSPELSRYWCKHLKKSKPEIEAAIAKVGNNAATVLKELSKGSRDSIRSVTRAVDWTSACELFHMLACPLWAPTPFGFGWISSVI